MEILFSAGVTDLAVTTTPLNLLSDSVESYECPVGRRWRLNVASTTTDITVKVYVRAGANATSGLVELTALATTVTAGSTKTIQGEGECAQTIKVMGYTAAGTATVNSSFASGD